MTAPCPCGGETAVDSFDWPGRARIWFLRCDVCSGMSDAADTPEAAALLEIKTEQGAEKADVAAQGS